MFCRDQWQFRRSAPTSACLILVLASACGGGRHDVALPTKVSDGPGPSASPTSADEAISQAYARYWAVLPDAEHADSKVRRQQILADYLIDPQLSTALHGIDDLHQQGQTSSGYVIVHIKKIQVDGDAAKLWDCQDATKALLRKRSTGKIISRGVPNDHFRAALSRGSDGRWRISKFTVLGAC